jgi:hypothetical protein
VTAIMVPSTATVRKARTIPDTVALIAPFFATNSRARCYPTLGLNGHIEG